MFKPASAIVDEVFLDNIDDRPCPSLPKPANLARAANRLRQCQRPNDPTDLEFVLQEHIPAGFLQKDICVRERRHLVFATEQQLKKLNSDKTWYIDGPFKLCRHPFTQLVTINAFVRSDDHIKQVPLVSVLMSGKKKKDYTKVLKSIVHLLPNPVVQKVVIDFESAIWGALRQVLLSVVIIGCVFHWTQALWHKIQALGLQAAYTSENSTFKFLRRVMAFYHSCLMARLPMCSTNFYQRPQQHHYRSSWNMFKTHGSTAMFGHLPAGVCTRKLFAPTRM